MNNPKHRFMIFLYIIAAVYFLLVAGLFIFQRKVMYLPDQNIGMPEQYGLSGFEDFLVTSGDGTKVQLWYKKAAEKFPTIVYYHGNAAHLGNRAGIYHALAEKGFGVLALSYRGYGKSEGTPHEQGIYADARAAIRYLTDEQKLPLSQILLFGESLGSGVAVQMATEHKVAGVVLEAPYTSVVNRAAEIYFYIPVRLLIKDHYDSIHKLPRVLAPVLIFHGELDATIPIAHGRAMYAAVQSPKKAYFFANVGHTDFDSPTLASHILDFAQEYHMMAH